MSAMETIERNVVDLAEVDRGAAWLVGGKGAHLGELARIDGIDVPAGFCVTTHVFRRVTGEAPHLERLLDRLAFVEAGDRDGIGSLCAEIRTAIESVVVAGPIAAEITRAVERLGADDAYAVRSSATAEDLPSASFAGQQDTYLNVVGASSVVDHVVRCWASLFTERAATYRIRNGFDHRRVQMGVVVQRMLVPVASGIMFTADPVSGNRTVVTIEAGFGLGESLVSGLVDPDMFTIRYGEIVDRAIVAKRLMIEASAGGGTHQRAVDAEEQEVPSLRDDQVVRLAAIGRLIERHFGRPQDIEWCVVGDTVCILQSRPITTLYPVPVVGDGDRHLYVSVGHQQMMTDPMKPLGLSMWKLKARPQMFDAGGRLFVDIAAPLADPASRAGIVAALAQSDPLLGDALQRVLERDDILPPRPDRATAPPAVAATDAPPARASPEPIATDPEIVATLRRESEASVDRLRHEIAGRTGLDLIDFILADIAELKRILFDPLSHQAIMAGMEATWWLNDQLAAWLGERNAADALAQSAPDNITSEMGLALLDVADAIRPYPDVVAFLREVADAAVADERFTDELDGLAGGPPAREAIMAYLDVYGMRCAGEIDITRPRWAERPSTLVPLILGNIEHVEAGAGARRFEQGRVEAAAKEAVILERLRTLPDGDAKAAETKRMIDRVRTFIGYREYPKYGIVCRSFIYKQALLAEAERQVAEGVLHHPEDIFFLTMDELRDVVATGAMDHELIRSRAAEHETFWSLTPPRLFTSDGEVITGSYRRDDLPADALAGLAVSAGTIEGRARVILDMSAADIEPGDILVTAYTDPSWSPLFVAIVGLVTEVGGLMTHGAVIAREYGLPAVVGVEHATQRIRDGQRIRVLGTDGYVELLEP